MAQLTPHAAGGVVIYLDQHSEPKDIARILWRELGPQTCIAIALSLVEERPLLIINNLMGVNDEA